MQEKNIANPSEKKSSHKGRTRAIAGIVAVGMIVSTVYYNLSVGVSVEIAPNTYTMQTDGQAVLDKEAIKANFEAIKEALELQDELNEAYQQSQKLIDEGNYEEAIGPTEKVYEYLKDDKSSGPYLRVVLSELYYATGDYTSCSKICTSIIKREESAEGSAELMDGLCKAQLGDDEGALERFREALEGGCSDTATCYLQMAVCYSHGENYEKVAEYAAKASEQEHDSSLDETIYYLGSISTLKLGDYENSLKQLDKLIAVTPSGEYYYYRGVANMAVEKYSEAVDDYAQALAKGYEDTDCYYNLAVCGLKSSRNEEAADSLEKLLSMEELGSEIDRGECYYLKGLAKMLLSELDECAEDFRAAIDNGYTSNDCYYNLALICMKNGDYEEAEASMSSLIDLNDETDDSNVDIAECYYLRGVARMAQAQYVTAGRDLAKAILQGETGTGSYYNLGTCLYAQGKWEEAKKNLEVVRKRDDNADYLEATEELLKDIDLRINAGAEIETETKIEAETEK